VAIDRVARVLALALALAACQTPSSTPPMPTGPIDARTTESPPAARTLAVDVLEPASAISVQVCAQTSDVEAQRRSLRLLDSLADVLDRRVAVDASWSTAMFLEVWAPGLAVQASIPEIRPVTIEPGLDGDTQAQLLEDQVEQRERIPAIREMAETAIRALREVQLPADNSISILGCVSRANQQLDGRDPSRRLLIISAVFPVEPESRSVVGDLRDTNEILLLGWGPNVPGRFETWRPIWDALGASVDTNLEEFRFEDGTGRVLDEAVERLLNGARE